MVDGLTCQHVQVRQPSQRMSFGVEKVFIKADKTGWREDQVKVLERLRKPETLHLRQQISAGIQKHLGLASIELLCLMSLLSGININANISVRGLYSFMCGLKHLTRQVL